MQRNGRKNFIRAIEQISKGNQSAADVVAELGTMKDGGILPDSYPESAEPDDDFNGYFYRKSGKGACYPNYQRACC